MPTVMDDYNEVLISLGQCEIKYSIQLSLFSNLT